MTAGGAHTPLLKVTRLQALLPTPRGLVRAVDRVSFELAPGRTLGIVGESGCGKSMLARAIMGLLPPSAIVSPGSTIQFDGHSLIGMPGPQLRTIVGRQMAMIFQDPMTTLNPVMTIGRQVAEVVRHHLKASWKRANQRACDLLERVGIPMAAQRADHYPHQLSGGLRQRVAIAIALACDPKLLIADEPTTALDVTVQAAILDLLARLQLETRMAMILITHDLGVVAGRTHETAVMYAGRFVEHAPTAILFKQMGMPYTRALMAAIPRLADSPHKTLQAIDGQPPDMVDPPAGCRFAPRCWRVRQQCTAHEPALQPVDGSGHRLACWFPLDPEKD
jgi:peptide/nickel transport system ATP-binding protein